MLVLRISLPRPCIAESLVVQNTEFANVKRSIAHVPLENMHIQPPSIRQIFLSNLNEASKPCTCPETVVQQVTGQRV